MNEYEVKQFVSETLEQQDEVRAVKTQADGSIGVYFHDRTELTIPALWVQEPPAAPVSVEDDARGPILWEIVNGWHSDVTIALRACAEQMATTDAPLRSAELFEIAVNLRNRQRDGEIQIAAMDNWWETVEIAHDALLVLNGDVPERFQDTFNELLDEGHGAVGNYAETGRLMQFATGPMPAHRYSAEK